MKQITEEQIIKTVQEVTNEVAKTTAKDFLEALDKQTKELSEELKNNPLTYHEFAVTFAQGNSALIIQEVLCRLFCDESV